MINTAANSFKVGFTIGVVILLQACGQQSEDHIAPPPEIPFPTIDSNFRATYSIENNFMSCNLSNGISMLPQTAIRGEFVNNLNFISGSWLFDRSGDANRLKPIGWTGVFGGTNLHRWEVKLNFSKVAWTEIPSASKITGIYEITAAQGRVTDLDSNDFMEIVGWKNIYFYAVSDNTLLFPKQGEPLRLEMKANYYSADIRLPRSPAIPVMSANVNLDLFNQCH